MKEVEEQLGANLPDAYKSFLLQSDGLVNPSFDLYIFGLNNLTKWSSDEYPDIIKRGWLPYSENGLGEIKCVNLKDGNVAIYIFETDSFEEEDRKKSFDESLTDLIESLAMMEEGTW